MKQQNESVEKLEVGKDYVRINNNKFIVIDRNGNFYNKGFDDGIYENNLSCSNSKNWREATEEEVIEAFKKHLVHRYGEGWETMKIKEKHPGSLANIDDSSWNVEISKCYDGWNVWNKNGLLYCDGVWVERIEEPTKSTEWTPAPEDIETMNKNVKASNTQIGGSHYSDMAIQPIEFIHKNGLSFIQGNIIKYVCRYKSKGGIEDLNKAKHYIDLLIELEEK